MTSKTNQLFQQNSHLKAIQNLSKKQHQENLYSQEEYLRQILEVQARFQAINHELRCS